MPDSGECRASRLYEAACLYHQIGWSVIPLRGDSHLQNPKAPAVLWAEYQQRQPTLDELEHWFLHDAHAALGIVCGKRSRLIVLDFDDAALAAEFERCFPDLARTLIARSGNRGTPHYYYRSPEQLRVQSRHVKGADLLGEGAYVVAMPSQMGGCEWVFANDEVPLNLSPIDLKRIIHFFSVREYIGAGGEQSASPRLPVLNLKRSDTQVVQMNPDTARTLEISPEGARHWYRVLAAELGRNNALFRVAGWLRDYGWTCQQVLRQLVDTHTVQPPNDQHPPETPEQRRREAARTIYSAFKNPARAVHKSKKAAVVCLPNAVRERLLRFGQVAAARVLDALLLCGIRTGELFTERFVCEILNNLNIGRRAVQAALKTIIGDIHPLFRLFNRVNPPQTPPEPQNANAATDTSRATTKCYFVRGTNRVKSHDQTRSGCPPRWFIMPSMSYLCRILRVSPTWSDPIEAADLYSPKTYRQALQRSLMQRRPALYSRAWLAERLGISRRTCRRYDRQIGLRVRPTYREKCITWGNLQVLPLSKDDFEPEGVFIEAPDGTRYPPFRPIAARLLRQYSWLLLKYQDWNFYAYGHLQADWRLLRREIRQTPLPVEQGWREGDREIMRNSTLTAVAVTGVSGESAGGAVSVGAKHRFPQSESSAASQTSQSASENNYNLLQELPALPAQPVMTPRLQALVEQLYQKVAEQNADRALTRAKAYALVEQYGEKLVKQALSVLEKRKNINNPAGFVIVYLRSEARFAKP